jgi:putative endonuclease
MYHVYIVECNDKSLYTGISRDIEKRLFEHNNSEKGAKYTRSKRPVKLVYSAVFTSRSEAAKEEYRIKKLSKDEKIKLISTF